MQAGDNLFLWLVRNFGTDRYMWHTKIQAICWSVADVVLIFFFLKIVDQLKARHGEKPIRYRYGWLWATATLKVIPFFFNTPETFISLDFLICALQYAILLCTVIMDYKLLKRLPEWFSQ